MAIFLNLNLRFMESTTNNPISIENGIENLTKLPTPLVVILSLYILGMLLKRIKQVPNVAIPWILTFGSAILWGALLGDVNSVGFKCNNPVVMLYITGFLYGAGAVALNQFTKNIPFVEKFTKAFGKGFSDNSDDTVIITKQKVKENENKPSNDPNDSLGG